MNIYVGNLHYGVNEDELTEIFGKFGTVNSVKVITDKYSGQSKGFAFVEMEDDAEGNQAIGELNGIEISGRNLKVNVAHEKKRDPNRR
jgi:RNA recognition motif-containing protein